MDKDVGLLEGIYKYTCLKCKKQTTGHRPPTKCNKCGGMEFDEMEMFQTRPVRKGRGLRLQTR
jgi:hypothetical protein